MSAWPLVNPSQTRMEVSWPFGDFGEDRQETSVFLPGGSELRGLSEGPWPHSLSLAGPLAPFPLWGDCIHGLIVGRQTPGLGLRMTGSVGPGEMQAGAWRQQLEEGLRLGP